MTAPANSRGASSGVAAPPHLLARDKRRTAAGEWGEDVPAGAVQVWDGVRR